MKDWTTMRAADVMGSPLVSLEKDTSLEDAAITLSEHQISGAIVTDYGGEPLGVVSLFDIVSYVSGLDRPENVPGGFYRYSYPRFGEGGEGWEEVRESALKETPVGEIMTTEIISVGEEAALSEVVRTMWENRIHRVFVSRNAKPVGVITSMDVLRTLAGGRARPRSRSGGRGAAKAPRSSHVPRR